MPVLKFKKISLGNKFLKFLTALARSTTSKTLSARAHAEGVVGVARTEPFVRTLAEGQNLSKLSTVTLTQ